MLTKEITMSSNAFKRKLVFQDESNEEESDDLDSGESLPETEVGVFIP